MDEDSTNEAPSSPSIWTWIIVAFIWAVVGALIAADTILGPGWMN